MKQAIETNRAPAAIGPYSQATLTGNLLTTSGQVPIDPETGKLVAETIEEQTHQVMRNLAAVLGAANCSWSNVVKATIFVTDLSDFQTVNEIYASYLDEPYPARSTIQVAALPLGSRIEIEMIATTAG